MIDFVNTPQLLRIALQVAMATMHFHIAKTGLFIGFFFRIQGVPGNNMHQFKIVLGVQGRSN